MMRWRHVRIRAARENARAVLTLRAEAGGLEPFLWGFVDGAPLVNRWTDLSGLPASTELSVRVSNALARRGFRFVGPTIVYAFMQSVGLVDDHLPGCFRYRAAES